MTGVTAELASRPPRQSSLDLAQTVAGPLPPSKQVTHIQYNNSWNTSADSWRCNPARGSPPARRTLPLSPGPIFFFGTKPGCLRAARVLSFRTLAGTIISSSVCSTRKEHWTSLHPETQLSAVDVTAGEGSAAYLVDDSPEGVERSSAQRRGQPNLQRANPEW